MELRFGLQKRDHNPYLWAQGGEWLMGGGGVTSRSSGSRNSRLSQACSDAPSHASPEV